MPASGSPSERVTQSSGRVTHVVDLASRWLGGSVMAASDESFGEKENLLNPAAASFEPGYVGEASDLDFKAALYGGRIGTGAACQVMWWRWRTPAGGSIVPGSRRTTRPGRSPRKESNFRPARLAETAYPRHGAGIQTP